MTEFDVIVVGAGNAGLCAAIAAAEKGAKVCVLEKAPESEAGGNSAHTGGAFRVAYDGLDDLLTLMPDLSEQEIAQCDFGQYTADTFYDDLAELSNYRADPDVLYHVTSTSLATLQWMQRNGVRFMPIFGRQAVKQGSTYRFWGGLTIEVAGGGLQLVTTLRQRLLQLGGEYRYESRATDLCKTDSGWEVTVNHQAVLSAKSVIIATGGFHGNLRWRTQYLGPNWDLAKVRGSRHNTGDGIDLALQQGAMAHGNWSGCHAVFYDANAPQTGDLNQLNMQKNYFNFGVVVNRNGRRFVDEGRHFRNYIYSSMGAEVLKQPKGIAWQIFDNQTAHLLPDEYRTPRTTRYQADTLEALAAQIPDMDGQAFVAEMEEFSRQASAINTPYDPTALDGRRVEVNGIPKSNWALPMSEPPFMAYEVSCGITFTYGGLKVSEQAQVLDENDKPIGGLYAAGELVGNLYFGGYAGGAGLTSGSVLGRTAGEHAATTNK